jgi:putative ABC transport system ATP-binding protein
MLEGPPMPTPPAQDTAGSGVRAPEGRAGVAVAVESLGHVYRTPHGPLPVLDGLDLTLPAGGYASFSGPSGSGKTTLLSLIGGLERPQSGSIVVGGVDLRSLDRDGLAAFRCKTVGFVFQHFGLLDTLSARENVEFACMLAGSARHERRRHADELLAAVGLGGRADHRPAALSGGERQRVAIARSLANDPALILADEPTGNLDDDAADAVIELLEALRRARRMTLVVVTHRRDLAGRAVDRFELVGGRLERR